MTGLLTRKLKKKLSLSLSGLFLSTALTLSAAPAAEAFDWSNAIGSIVLVSAQYSMLNKQVAYLDGKGRGEYLDQIKGQEGVNEDPEANAMLDRVMGRLSGAIAKTDPSIEKNPYHYFVNNSTKFNAYCTLGHNVSVNIGLFTTLNYNEDEVAFVLGHGEQHDPANGVKRTFPIALLAAVAGSQSNMLEAVGTNLLANLGSAKLVTLPMEKKADELGFTYATEAGYNPGAGSALWQRVMEKMGNNRETFLGTIFMPSDHPNNGSRRDKYTKRMYEYSGKHVNVDKKTGAILVNKKNLGLVRPGGDMSSRERTYLVAGSLARVYHEQPSVQPSAEQDGSDLYFGGRRIMSLQYGDDGTAWVEKLNKAAGKGKQPVKQPVVSNKKGTVA
ncbi:M48 family metallopeptidase [Acidaminococcus fermentans]|uniref:M48 family metallopeptidase n=1 Tax=Acidaminococcus fermentans TaxID=905 RepID=UPI00265F5F91|nr:M48 family metallopeptidase [Acidaminococcus fermentans]